MKDAAAKHIDASEILNERFDSASADAARLSSDSCSCLNAGSSSSVRGSNSTGSRSCATSPNTFLAEDGPKTSSGSGSTNMPFPLLMDALSFAGFTMAIVCMVLSIISLVIRRFDFALVAVILAALFLVLNVGNVIAISIWRKKNLNEPNPKQ